MSLSRVVVAPLLLAAALLAPTTPAVATSDPPCAPGVGIGLVEFPAGNHDPRAHTYVVDHVRPGARFSRRFQVCNGTRSTVHLLLYAGAAHIANGSFQIDVKGTPNQLSRWITVSPSTLSLAPGERRLARATFVVPADAEQGEQYAVLLAEEPAPAGSGGIPVTTRVGIRVYLDIGPGGAPKSDFDIDSMQASRSADGKELVTAQVHNTGKRALDITGSLALRDGPGGLAAGPYPAQLGTTLAPGETEPVVIPVGASIAAGPWTAELTLRSGLLERRVKAGLTFPDAPGATGPPVDVEKLPVASDNVIRPGGTIGVVALLLVALAAMQLVRRRRTSRHGMGSQ